MDLTHRFTVPVGVQETWAQFNDIASVAECFPGAQVTSAEGDSFAGTVKVKLGPIALVYNGTGTFVEKDEALHRFVVDAKGKDKRGNGTAGATVTVTMASSAGDAGSTDVEVVTDLAITGKPAQFGRGVMQDVSDKLLGQFVSCLEERLAAPPAPPPLLSPLTLCLTPMPPVSDEVVTSEAAVPAAERRRRQRPRRRPPWRPLPKEGRRAEPRRRRRPGPRQDLLEAGPRRPRGCRGAAHPRALTTVRPLAEDRRPGGLITAVAVPLCAVWRRGPVHTHSPGDVRV